MIIETATIAVVPGREDEFVAALAQAEQVLARAGGWRSLEVRRGIERPSTFQLVIGWDTLADHTVGFREGELFGQWRAIIGPFFAAPPDVEHWAPVG